MAFIKPISSNTTDDASLIRAYKQTGSLETLGTLFSRYMDLVYAVCMKYLKDAETARDATMQVFELLIVALKKHEVDNFRSWLHTLAKNHCLMQLRTPRNLRTVEFNPLVMQSHEDVHLNGVFQREENFQQLDNCMKELSDDQRESIDLFYLQQKCYKDIAALTGHEVNKVRSLIQNGRRNLKICMDKYAASAAVH